MPKNSRKRGSSKNGCCRGARTRRAERTVTTAGATRSTMSAKEPRVAVSAMEAEGVFDAVAGSGAGVEGVSILLLHAIAQTATIIKSAAVFNCRGALRLKMSNISGFLTNYCLE